MLYFSKFKSTLVLLIALFGIIISIPNFFDEESIKKWPALFPSNKINLGLDLAGGSHLLIEVDVPVVISERIETIYSDLRIQLRKERVSVDEIAKSDSQIFIVLSDGQLKEKVIGLVDDLSQPILGLAVPSQDSKEILLTEDTPGTLTIKLSDEAINSLTSRSVDQSIEIVRRRIDELGTKEPSIQRQGKERILIQVPGLDNPKRLKDLLGATAKLTFHLMDPISTIDDLPRNSMIVYGRDDEKLPYVIERRSIIGGENLIDARPGFEPQTNQPIVDFRFDNQGARRFGKVTTDNVGKPFAIVLDNEVISAPIINEPILGGSGMISGGFSVEEANDLAILLRAGALPAPLIILEERTVGPDLGADSIKAGKVASFIGLCMVLVYMFISYGRFGLYSNVSLIVNISLIVAILSLLQATLTLPGIAGIILTIGMAVDANVLIFERIREELSNNKSIINAIDNGYKRALTTILDANITTFIAAIILFQLGSGPIKGFSITLAIGILTSVFTAFTLTRLFVAFWVKRNNPKEINI